MILKQSLRNLKIKNKNQPSIEELLSQIELMKQALLFYSNEKNYLNDGNGSIINKDNGMQAKFVLENIKKISTYQDELIDELKNIEKQFDSDSSNIVSDLEKLNKITYKINNKKNG